MDVGSDIIHVKGIPIEHWDEAEMEEYCVLMDKKIAKLKSRNEERQRLNDELFGKLKSFPDSDQ